MDHEVLDDTVEDDTVIEPVAGEEDKVVHRLWRADRVELDHYLTVTGVERGRVPLVEIDGHLGRGVVLLRHLVLSVRSRAGIPALEH